MKFLKVLMLMLVMIGMNVTVAETGTDWNLMLSSLNNKLRNEKITEVGGATLTEFIMDVDDINKRFIVVYNIRSLEYQKRILDINPRKFRDVMQYQMCYALEVVQLYRDLFTDGFKITNRYLLENQIIDITIDDQLCYMLSVMQQKTVEDD